MLVFAGQQVRFSRPAPEEPEVPRDLRVIFTDPHFYVLDKPSGLPIHPSARYHHSTLTAVHLSLYLEAGRGCRRSDQVHDHLVVHQGATSPVVGDVAE